MMRTERRETPRMAVEGLAYINLDPNNGGIILNISEGGLCFHSTIPVQKTALVRFWFAQRATQMSADDRLALRAEPQTRGGIGFIEVDSELAWTDETKKRGGLRFTNLPADARKEIREWMSQHAMPSVAEKSAPLLPSRHESFSERANRWDAIAARRRSSAALRMLSPNLQSSKLLTGFSGGLVAGVLISSLVAGLFLLQTHRSEIGESLIHLGERMGGKSSAKQPAPSQSALSEPPGTSSELQPDSGEPEAVSPEPQTTSRAEIAVPRPERPAPQTPVAEVKPHEVKLETTTPAVATALPVADVKPPATKVASSKTPALVPAVAETITSEPNSAILRAMAPKVEPASEPSVRIERSKGVDTESPSEKFLEVGRFNEKAWADKTTEQLSQFGFSTTVTQKNRFWKKSYQVLVGPYGSDSEAETAHKDLASRGFTPRSFERGSRGFLLPPALRVDGTRMPVGDCVVSWESYIPDAIVKVEGNGGFSATVEGKWVKRGFKYYQNAVVYRKNADGSRTLLEIQFSGMTQALVLGKGNI
jgi:hypothetical protein